ncbi:MAG: hypothetical protein AVDCRST_MAG03-1448, partial [uncultured Rubrobacteraceae bacterium]
DRRPWGSHRPRSHAPPPERQRHGAALRLGRHSGVRRVARPRFPRDLVDLPQAHPPARREPPRVRRGPARLRGLQPRGRAPGQRHAGRRPASADRAPRRRGRPPHGPGYQRAGDLPPRVHAPGPGPQLHRDRDHPTRLRHGGARRRRPRRPMARRRHGRARHPRAPDRRARARLPRPLRLPGPQRRSGRGNRCRHRGVHPRLRPAERLRRCRRRVPVDAPGGRRDPGAREGAADHAGAGRRRPNRRLHRNDHASGCDQRAGGPTRRRRSLRGAGGSRPARRGPARVLPRHRPQGL